MNVVTVKEYNQTVKPDSTGYRYTFDTLKGIERQFGYVASVGNSHFFARTKRDAIAKCLQRTNKE